MWNIKNAAADMTLCRGEKEKRMDANSEAAAISDAVGRFLLLFMSFFAIFPLKSQGCQKLSVKVSH